MPPEGPALKPEEIALAAGLDCRRRRLAGALGVSAAGATSPVPQFRDRRSTPDWPRRRSTVSSCRSCIEQGLSPAPPADKRTLLRRVYFDLIGLPPTPEELDAFLRRRVARCLRAGRRSAARQPAVRRALGAALDGRRPLRRDARPRPGPPARECLAVSRLSDPLVQRRQAVSRGSSRSRSPATCCFPDDPQAIVATGFLAAGPWDESSLRDIREDTIDREIARYLDRDDMVTTVMSTFVSTHGPLCPLPRSQVRPDHAARLLRPAGRLRRDRQGEPRVRPRSAGRRATPRTDRTRWPRCPSARSSRSQAA